jgi:hypothetical protein
MKFVDEYRHAESARRYLNEIRACPSSTAPAARSA